MINLIGPVTDKTGYGVHLTQLALALNRKTGISLTARSQVHPELARDDSIMTLVNESFNYNAPSICIWFADCMQLFTGAKRIGFPVFEVDKLTENECNHLKSLDAVLVTSKWAEEVVCNSAGDLNTCVVGEGYNPNIFKPADPITNYLGAGFPRPFIQNIGKWEDRKGHPLLIKALGELANENIKCTFYGFWENIFNPQWQFEANMHLGKAGFTSMGKALPGGAGYYQKKNVIVSLPPRLNTQAELSAAISMCDFGVYPYKAEGWGLPILETMACGRPVIATNYSGPTEYLTPECGQLLTAVGAEKVPLAFNPKGNLLASWAAISLDELREAIRTMIIMPESERDRLGAKAHKRATAFTWDASANKIIAFLSKQGWLG